MDENFTLKVDNLDDPSVAAERLVWASADLKGKELPPELIAKKEVKTILEARLPEL